MQFNKPLLKEIELGIEAPCSIRVFDKTISRGIKTNKLYIVTRVRTTSSGLMYLKLQGIRKEIEFDSSIMTIYPFQGVN